MGQIANWCKVAYIYGLKTKYRKIHSGGWVIHLTEEAWSNTEKYEHDFDISILLWGSSTMLFRMIVAYLLFDREGVSDSESHMVLLSFHSYYDFTLSGLRRYWCFKCQWWQFKNVRFDTYWFKTSQVTIFKECMQFDILFSIHFNHKI
jgi:hypothetical protein